jgi:hypothetical protein
MSPAIVRQGGIALLEMPCKAPSDVASIGPVVWRDAQGVPHWLGAAPPLPWLTLIGPSGLQPAPMAAGRVLVRTNGERWVSVHGCAELRHDNHITVPLRTASLYLLVDAVTGFPLRATYLPPESALDGEPASDERDGGEEWRR